MSWEVIAAFTGVGLTIISSIILSMRGLAKIENNLREFFEAKIKSDINDSRRMFGESVKSIKEHSNIAHSKIDALTIQHQELELYIRDNYVEVRSFNTALEKLERTIESMDGKIDKLMARREPR